MWGRAAGRKRAVSRSSTLAVARASGRPRAVNEQVTDAATRSGWKHARGGLAAAVAGGLFIAQAGGSDRELFLSFGFILGAIGLLHITISGVTLGIAHSRG